MTRRPAVGAIAAAAVLIAALTIGQSRPAAPGEDAGAAAASPDPTDPPIRIPVPGHEVYGYVPYWEMGDGIADHLAATELTTLALFSVTHGGNGALAAGERGYRRITSDIGARLIDEAHQRGTRVELVYTSFGTKKNAAFHARPEVQDRTIAELVAFAADNGFDGINVDVELLDAEHVPAYGDFVRRLRGAFRDVVADGQVSVATSANVRGGAMALAASLAGADRIFVMGYDYHWSGSGPGASAPLDRRDGSEKDLPWSLDLYRDLGVPAERTVLGLPLYGMSWTASGPQPGDPATSRGEIWIPGDNVALLADPSTAPTFDPLEGVELLALPDGDAWQAIYFDSPASLAAKLALADDRGLAGAGFWAIGYERGLPDYTRLIAAFAAGDLADFEAVAAP